MIDKQLKIIRIVLLFLPLIILFDSNFNSEHIVSGSVYDKETNKPISGAIIRVEGADIGESDLDGKYEIKVNSDNAKLSISFIGYEQKIVHVKGRTTIDIELIRDVFICY